MSDHYHLWISDYDIADANNGKQYYEQQQDNKLYRLFKAYKTRQAAWQYGKRKFANCQFYQVLPCFDKFCFYNLDQWQQKQIEEMQFQKAYAQALKDLNNRG